MERHIQVLDKTHISLQAMFLEYMRVKGKNEFVRVPVNPSLFYRVHIYITSEDVIQVATQDELTGSAMLFGLRCIWENLNQRQILVQMLLYLAKMDRRYGPLLVQSNHTITNVVTMY
ncbi:uncharacterized protein LOC115722101 [Cannabis sativa]|uniref:uncharacterized protein LOC115722101 n=1 Tax=Cannabis sativa TaxID=3483 RepID=UPI0029C9E14A|nr:uncharacterized protein LOC115722101 [Cannabis sativa]XP_060964120.1 uncharacterized protein LOC115722101 [Cannabis sativa]